MFGRVAEWMIAVLLKSTDGQPSVGSNPTPSANSSSAPIDNPFMQGDYVQLKGPSNPHKGNIKMGKAYQVLGTQTRSDFIFLRLDNGTQACLRGKDFVLKYAGNKTIPFMDTDEYENVIKAQESLDLANIKE